MRPLVAQNADAHQSKHEPRPVIDPATRTATLAAVKRSSIVLIFLAIAALAAGAWFLFWPRVSLPQDPLAAVPGDAFGFVRVRVDKVIASDAYKRLIVERGQARGIERVQVTCGFNPLERLKELVVFARTAPGGGVPRFAFTARGDLRHEELIDCVKKFTKGDASALQREDIEGIPTVQSRKGSSRAAFLGRDGIIGGDAESVRAAIHAVLGKAPSAALDPLLSGLYREIEQGSDITLVSRLPDELKPTIRQLGAVAGPRLQQLEELRALGANMTTSSGRLAGGAMLVTRDARQATDLVELGKSAIARLLNIPGIGLTPAAGVLRAVQMEARGDRATFAGGIKVTTIETLLELLPALEKMGIDLVAPRAGSAALPSDGDGGVSGAALPGSGTTQPTPTVEPLDPESASRRARRSERKARESEDKTPSALEPGAKGGARDDLADPPEP
jgi:hypothetical protein